jgi:hypothetical protein
MQMYVEEIKAIADQAQDILDYDAAHNEEILYAIDIVEGFLKKSRRLCYGGQAINAYMPDKHKFYDPLKNIPDYDFLTPSGSEDIRHLVRAFKEAGFTEIGVRPGMHKGTTKIYINYIAVADVTEINADFYKQLYERSRTINNIQYVDPNTLRMMMYLEMSRPRGEVERWEKVFQRLELLNRYVPIACGSAEKKGRAPRAVSKESKAIRKHLFDFVVYEQRVLVGADIVSFYRQRLRRGPLQIDWFINKTQPVVFYSDAAEQDAAVLLGQLGKYGAKVTVEAIPSEAEFFPQVVLISVNGDVVCGIIQETACHAYNIVELDSGKALRIGSFDTMIALYVSLTFQKKMDALLSGSIICMTKELVELQGLYRSRRGGREIFPIISLRCSGHQKQLSSLLREKVERIRAMKGVPATSGQRSKTMRSSNSRRATSAKGVTVKARR